jgi:hypothetical protein
MLNGLARYVARCSACDGLGLFRIGLEEHWLLDYRRNEPRIAALIDAIDHTL